MSSQGDTDHDRSDDPPEESGDGRVADRSAGISDKLLTALTTDHFVLQTAASTTVNEAVGRSTLYVSALSSSLVALGFSSSRPSLLAPLVALVIPTVFVLGIFTVVRLVDTGVANVGYLSQIARLRQRYAAIDDEAADFFPHGGNRFQQALGAMATSDSALSGLFTTASMIATINAIVGGVGAALLVRLISPPAIWLWVGAGVVVFAALVLAFVRYQQWRTRDTHP